MADPAPAGEAEPKDKEKRSRLRNIGGTPGGMAEFLIGLAMVIGGGYLFMDNIIVMGSLGSLWGVSSFGLTLIPIFAGIAILFFNGKNVFGWILTVGGLITIVLGVIVRMTIYYRPTSLFHTIVMIVLVAGGIGLIARSMRAH